MENTSTPSGKKSMVKQVLILGSAVALGVGIVAIGTWAVKKYLPMS
jgi:hypothetical protein